VTGVNGDLTDGEGSASASGSRAGDVAALNIVMRGAKDRWSTRARGILRDFDIDIDQADNGVWLPKDNNSPNPRGSAVHASLHTFPYRQWVLESLSAAGSRDHAISILQGLRERLLKGTHTQ